MCPNTPPSHNFTRLPTVFDPMIILRAMPYSRTFSSLFSFPEINSTHAPEIEIRLTTSDLLLKTFLYIIHRYVEPAIAVQCELDDNLQNGQVLVNPTVYTNEVPIRSELKCLSRAKKALKIWIDGDYVILWSCVNYTETEHDEAVVIMHQYRPDLVDINGDRLEKALEGGKNISKKYLSRGLFESINWKTSIENRKNFTKINDQFVCLSEFEVTILRLSSILGGYFLVAGLLMVLLFGNFRKYFKKVCKRNKVTPYGLQISA